jgi:hypothetical protein
MTSSLPRTRSTTELYGRERVLYHGQSGARNGQRAPGPPSQREKRTVAIDLKPRQVYRASQKLASLEPWLGKSPSDSVQWDVRTWGAFKGA